MTEKVVKKPDEETPLSKEKIIQGNFSLLCRCVGKDFFSHPHICVFIAEVVRLNFHRDVLQDPLLELSLGSWDSPVARRVYHLQDVLSRIVPEALQKLRREEERVVYQWLIDQYNASAHTTHSHASAISAPRS